MKYKIDGSDEVLLEEYPVADNNDKSVVKPSSPTKKNNFHQINLFSKQIVEKMIKDGVAPTPSNFVSYFEKKLEEKTPAQKEAIKKVVDLENSENFDINYLFRVENYLKENFKNTKKTLDDINLLYTKLDKIKRYIKSKGLELSKNPTKTNILTFESKISSAIDVLQKEQDKIKDDFLSISKLMKEFDKESIFDKKYDVYNKKYLLNMIDKEIKNLKNFDYNITIVSFSVKKDVLQKVSLQSDKDVIVKTVAHTILERSRRSDVIGHYDDGIFFIILKHTNYQQAIKAVESIKNYISFSNFIIDSQRIKAEIDTKIVELSSDLTKDEIVASLIKGL